MKKFLFAITAFLGLGLVIVATGCGGGGGGSDDDEVASTPSGSDDDEVVSTPSSGGSGSVTVSEDFVLVQGVTVTGGITGSSVLINSSVFKNGRTVNIPSLWACDHEVTQAEYEQYCTYGGSSPNATYGVGNNYPAYYVSWYDALVYCNKRSMAEGLTPCYTISGSTNPNNWGAVPTSSNETWNAATCNFSANGYRLPTEAEWEYLARGGNTSNNGQYIYSGSDTIGNVAWYYNNAYEMGQGNAGYGTHEVKTKAKNAKNLYDMSGNIVEWCWDWFDIISTETPSSGASSGSYRVSRGGDWGSLDVGCSVACRGSGIPNVRGITLGFRVVRTAD